MGTAFLVFIGVGSVPATLIVNGNAPFTMADLGMISLAFGTVVVATVYALGHIGGNHINPAVTLGLAVSGKFPWRQVPAYIAAQAAGAVLGAVAILGVLGNKASDVGLGVASYGGISWTQAFTAEFVGTFILVFTVFGVIHRKAAAGFAGVAIGLVVFAVIIPVAPGHRSVHQPGPHLRPDARPADRGRPREVEPDPRVPRRRTARRCRRRTRVRRARPHPGRPGDRRRPRGSIFVPGNQPCPQSVNA